jgi:hypothetical protein
MEPANAVEHKRLEVRLNATKSNSETLMIFSSWGFAFSQLPLSDAKAEVICSA